MEIKPIPTLPPQIIKASENKTLAIFVGAGLSRFMGCSSWGELAENLLRKCEAEGLLNNYEKTVLSQGGDFKKTITICNRLLSNDDRFMDEMRKSLNDHNVGDDSVDLQIYKDLFSLNGLIITTNADRHIDEVFFADNIVVDDFTSTTPMDNNHLYKIHGSITDQSSLIFTVERYLERYTDSKYGEFLQKIFTNYTVLFLGYGLSEFELMDYLFTSIHGTRKKHYFLKDYYTHEQRIYEFDQMYFDGLGIELIPYAKDALGFNQLPIVIEQWVNEVKSETLVLATNFDDMDDALRGPILSKISAAIQKMNHNEEYRKYFFRNAPKYQNLYLWLEPLYGNDYFNTSNIQGPIEDKNKPGYFSMPQWDVLEFLEAVALQNKDEPKEETTQLLFKIVDALRVYQSSETRVDNYRVDWYIVKLIFLLPSDKILLEYIDFIGLSLRDTKFSGILHSDIGKIVLPILIEHDMKEHLLQLLPILFECRTVEDSLKIKERIPLIDKYWLHEITKKYPKQIAKVVGVGAIELLIGVMDEILESDAGAFNNIWISAVEEHEQNSFPDRYDNQLVSFVRDMLEEASDDEVTTLVQTLFEKDHPIFIRLAFHTINHHYVVVKTEFWKWLESNDLPNSTYRHELYRLFQVRASEFSDEEVDKAIEWIENFDYSEYYDDMTPEQLEKLTAYRRKEWLMTLKDYSEKANELFMKYDSISPEEIDHPGFDFWSSGVRQLDKSPLKDVEDFCAKSVERIIEEIVGFDPKTVDKDPLINEKDWIEGLARDLGNCVQKNPQKFVAELEKFQEIDLVYYYYIFNGLERAWQDKEHFDWQNVFDLIETVLDASLLASNEKYAIWVKGKIPELIRAGTLKDDNAFDKVYLPRAKKILLDLLCSPEQEDGVSLDNLLSYSLNATNGKVLHGLMSYALRYGRLHSDQDVRWEEEVINFFSEQLDKDDSYSLYVFNIIGEYLPYMRFLDKQWVEENMDKIFAIENEKLWQAAFMSYMASSTMVYQKDYEYFRDNGHFTKALQHDWQDEHVKEKVLQFIVIAYMNGFDEDTVFQIISEKDLDNTLVIIRFVWHLYRDDPSEKRVLIHKLWNTIYDLYKDDANDDMQQVFSTLSKWFVFIDTIDETNMQWLELSAKYTEINYNSYFLLEQLLRLVEDSAKNVGKVYLSMLDNGVYPTYKEEDIIAIVEKLFENGELATAREICNKYASEGVYFLNDVNKRY